MGLGTLTIPAAGSVTAPTPFPFAYGSSVLRYASPYPWRAVPSPTQNTLLAFNGRSFPLHVIATNLVRLGLLAPSAALTAASTGTKATATLATTGNYTAADRFDLVSAGDENNYEWPVIVNTTFDTSEPNIRYWQVKRGASNTATNANIVKMIMGTGIDGTDYRSPSIDPGQETADHPASWSDWVTAALAAADANVVFTAVRAGTRGNSFEARERVDAGAVFTIGSTNKFSGGAAGTGTAPNFPEEGDLTYAYAYARSLDGALSGPSPVTSYLQGDPGTVSLTSIADPPTGTNESIDVKVWLRSVSDGAADVLREGYRIAVADTTDTDDLETDDLEANPLYDKTLYRSFKDGPVPRCANVATLKERMFASTFLPAADYSFGDCTVTNGSNAVVFQTASNVVPHPTQTWEGREFRVTTSALTEATTYRIVYVVEGTKTAYLDRAYDGSTNANATYTIRDVRDSKEVYWSEPKLPNNWPTKNALKGPLSNQPGGITALVTAFESIIAFTRTGVWRITGSDDFSFRCDAVYGEAGCVGSNAAVEAEGRLYWLGFDGVYRWGGQGLPTKISAPRGGDTPLGIQGTIRRINHAWSAYTVAVYSPDEKVIRWFVPLDDEVTNRYALVYDVQREVWVTDHYGVDVTAAATIPDRSGRTRTVVGTLQGDLIELDVSNSDGAYGFEPVAAITSSTRTTVTCSGASFPTSGDGLKGLPVTLVDSSGNVTYNTVASNTGTVLTLQRIVATAPTGTVIVGAIHGIIESGRFHLGDPGRDKVFPLAKVAFSPDSDGVFYLSVAANQDDVAVVDAAGGDLTLADGEEQFWPRVRGKLLKWRLDVLEPGCDPAFIAIRHDVVKKAAGRV